MARYLIVAKDSVDPTQLVELTAVGGALQVTAASGSGGDATAANQTSQITLETAIRDRIGEVQASPTSNTVLGRLKDLLTGIILAAGENHVGEVGGRAVRVSSSFTRPSDTTAYAAGDNMADSTSAPTVNTITGCARINGGSGVILGASLIDSANQATAGQIEAWVWDTSWTPDNDNAAFTPTDAECANVVAIIPLTTSYVGDATSGAGGNRVYISDPVNRGFVCAGGSTSLYWALVARNAYTPVSAEIFTLRLSILQN